MSMLQLHEDSAIAEYERFDIVEIDSAKLAQLGANFEEWTYPPQGSINGHRMRCYITNNFIYQAMATNCPRSALDGTSIIKNNNDWVVREGVYERNNTVMTPIQWASRPADFATNLHYHKRKIINNVAIYTPIPIATYYDVFDPNTTYYRDDSTKDNRQTRLFYTDAGFSFVVCCGSMTYADRYNNDGYTDVFKFQNFGGMWGTLDSGDWSVFPAGYCVNGNPYNIRTGASNRESMVVVGEVAIDEYYAYPVNIYYNGRTIENIKEERNNATFFFHTVYNNVDYYGFAFITLSDRTENAYPTALHIVGFSAEYWGTSIIAGGNVPSGSWGPVSGQSGGSGSWDNTDDSASINVPLPIASLPNALTVGGLHAYLMSESMLDKLSGLMYNPTTFNNFWSKWLNQKFNPISGIISIHKLPFAVQPTGTETFVRIAGAVLDATYMSDLGACLGDLISTQYTETPEYTASLPEYFGSFYDYDPFTKCYLHLPACGIIKVSANEIISGSVSVKYRCDILTGNVCAIIKTTDRNNVVKTQFVTGNCAYKLPFIGRDDGGVDNLVSLISGGISLLSGNVTGAIGAGKAIAEREHNTTITGDCTGNLTPLSDLKLWLEVVRVVPSTPDKKQEMQGIPANVYAMLYSLSGTGYAEIDITHLENMGDATESELTELETILRNGVIF